LPARPASHGATLGHFAAACGLTLEPFQRRIASAAAGPEREFVALLPRGQGKTHLLAIVALHHLLRVEDAAVYCAAASREQARILFEAAAGYARVLEHPNIVERHLELRWCPDAGQPKVFTRHLRVLAADAPRLHGLTPSLAIIDELQAHPDDSVYVALASALHKRPAAKLVVISTAGQGADSPLGRLRARALSLLEWATPDDADIEDARIVKRANPASWIGLEQLEHAHAALPELAYRRFVANQWTERAGYWLPPGAWQACVGEPEFEPGERVWLGVDVGGERSASAIVWVNERLHVGAAIYEGDAAVFDVIDHVRELAHEFTIAEVVFDPWRFGQAARELAAEGVPVVEFPQSDPRMIPASSTLHAAIVERRLTLPDDPELARHAANAVARHSRRGWRIDKPKRDTPIDAIVALAMAVERAEHQPEPVRIVAWI
jgi:phage terminase large subunit-like protein